MRGMLRAAKIPGDGRLGQCPSGEFIKGDGLFCGWCLPQDMNVIRAQLKGQGCTFKCHWTLQGPNVPLRERLTGAPSSPLTPHIRGTGKCVEVFVCLSQHCLKRKIFVLKTCLWRCLNEYLFIWRIIIMHSTKSLSTKIIYFALRKYQPYLIRPFTHNMTHIHALPSFIKTVNSKRLT